MAFPSSPTDGTLYTNGAGVTYQWHATPGVWRKVDPAGSLAGLSDVHFTSLADEEFLRYDAASGKWVAWKWTVTAIGAPYTLALADAMSTIQSGSVASIAVTVPPNSSVAFPVGTELEIGQTGLGSFILTAGAGVTFHSVGGQVASAGQFQYARLRQVAVNVWQINWYYVPAAAATWPVTGIGTPYTLALSDANSTIQSGSVATIAITVPPNASVAFPIGTEVEIGQTGLGSFSLTAGAGVTFHSVGGQTSSRKQFQYASLRKVDTDTWTINWYDAASRLADLTDVQLTSVGAGDPLVYDGSHWVNYNRIDVQASNVITAGAGALALDRLNGEVQRISLTGTVTSMTVANWPASGRHGRLMLEIVNTGAFNITGWPAGIIWSGGTAPTITSGAGKRDFIVLFSLDGGTTIYGTIAGQDYH